MPYYLNKNIDGLISADSSGDGYSIELHWATAYPTTHTNSIAYNIYMSNGIAPVFPSSFFDYGPTFISIDGYTSSIIVDLIPGEMYHFAVRAFEYDKTFFDLSTLPATYDGLVVLPQSLLSADISATAVIIPLVDASMFPNSSNGTVKIGSELINYSSVDYVHNTLIVPPGTGGLAAHLVDQGGGHFYTAAVGNIGSGTINSLTIVGADTTETWTIKCVFVRINGGGHPIAGTAKFTTIGSVSGAARDVYGNVPVWGVYSGIVSNGILSFSITETSTFSEGDSFIVKVAGPTLGEGSGRGYNGTVPEIHNTDGYDGYVNWDPNVIFWPVETEEKNTRVFECWNRFDIHHFPYTTADGYRQTTEDILTTNLTYSDTTNTGFPAYDFSGYHRTDPVLLLNGTCIGSYIGGQQGCTDSYSGVGLQVRGLNIQTANMQRQEVLLSTTGEPVCLIQREWTGITCDCMLPYNEYPEARCNKCFGGGKVVSYIQFFDPRRSDGRIMVRFDPTIDDLKATSDGLESEFLPNCWTLPVPTLKDRSLIVRFDEDGNEEFRYEILNVTRNKLLLDMTGVQKFAVQRVRKTDALYQIPVVDNTALYPNTIYTSFASSPGIPNHQHTIQINENITNINQINQLTGVAAGHNHVVRNGVVLTERLGHIHTITL